MTSSLSPVVAHDSLLGCSSFVKMLSCCEHTVVHNENATQSASALQRHQYPRWTKCVTDGSEEVDTS